MSLIENLRLTEIRDLLSQINDKLPEPARCPHGNAGVCMKCIVPMVEKEVRLLSRDIRREVARGVDEVVHRDE